MFQFSRERLHVQVLLFTRLDSLQALAEQLQNTGFLPVEKYLDAECSKYEIGIAEKVCQN